MIRRRRPVGSGICPSLPDTCSCVHPAGALPPSSVRPPSRSDPAGHCLFATPFPPGYNDIGASRFSSHLFGVSSFSVMLSLYLSDAGVPRGLPGILSSSRSPLSLRDPTPSHNSNSLLSAQRSQIHLFNLLRLFLSFKPTLLHSNVPKPSFTASEAPWVPGDLNFLLSSV